MPAGRKVSSISMPVNTPRCCNFTVVGLFFITVKFSPMMRAFSRLFTVIFLLGWMSNPVFAQGRLTVLQAELQKLQTREDSLLVLIENERLDELRTTMRAIGYPQGEVIEHSAMALSYDETHEQARWVMHVILPLIIEGSVSRTNDFRPDPKVSTGSAVEEDYFLKTKKPDGSFEYDGFGYDRGHLAPSADFRWSRTALSESYYYSNMAPQLPEFNREGWASLEDAIRGYVYRNPKNSLVVVTLPLLREGLPKIERSVNGVSIPDTFIKVVCDPIAQRGIAFVAPHAPLTKPLKDYATTVDEAERLSGFDFFSGMDEKTQSLLEASLDLSAWFSDEMLGDVEPLDPTSLPRGHFNTTQAAYHSGKGKEVIVCGTVVGTRTSRSGNVWLNFDRQYPNQVFSVYIKKEHLVNFSYDPEKALKGLEVCVKADIMDLGGTPTMRIEREKQIVVRSESER